MLRFASPLYLTLLLLLPPVFWRRWRQYRRRPALGMTALEGATTARPSGVLRLRWIAPAAKWTAMAAIIFAMAGARGPGDAAVARTTGGNTVMAIDVSESMGAIDIPWHGRRLSRLEAVKRVTRDFIAGRRGGRVAVVLFGSEAFTRLPLTSDYAAASAVISRLQVGAAGRRTAMGDAIGIALKRLEANAGVPGAILLLTDGRHNAGRLRPLAAAELAAERGIRIYPVGIGGHGPARFLMQHPLRGRRWVERHADLDEDTLRAVAAATGGRYYRASDFEGLQQIWEEIAFQQDGRLPRQPADGRQGLFAQLLLLALGLLALAVMTENTCFLRLP